MARSTSRSTLDALRRQLSGTMRNEAALIRPKGLAGAELPGLARDRMHEILPGHPGEATAIGFAACLLAGACAFDKRPVMWVVTRASRRETGRLYPPGLLGMPSGARLDPSRLIVVNAGSGRDALWTMEEALRSGALCGVAGNAEQLDFTSSRRLSLAAGTSGTPLFLLRPWNMEQTTAAATRWRVAPLPSLPDPFDRHAPGAPAWQIELLRSRDGRSGCWQVHLAIEGSGLDLEPCHSQPHPPQGLARQRRDDRDSWPLPTLRAS